LSGTNGTVWQHTAIDVASAFCWTELHASERNPRSRHTRELLHRVAAELARAGWKLREVTTDNASEFRANDFGRDVERLGAHQRFIRAGRPNSNGCVERVQLTILEECWRPAFARSLVPKMTALSKDPDEYLIDDNTDRAHTGRPHPRPRARRHRLRRTQDQPRTMSTRGHNSGLGRFSRRRCPSEPSECGYRFEPEGRRVRRTGHTSMAWIAEAPAALYEQWRAMPFT
jgi:transposase InsO family protein